MDDINITASLFSRIYPSSLAGKPEESGTAMLSQAKMESNVTVGRQRSNIYANQISKVRTYIVIAIF